MNAETETGAVPTLHWNTTGEHAEETWGSGAGEARGGALPVGYTPGSSGIHDENTEQIVGLAPTPVQSGNCTRRKRGKITKLLSNFRERALAAHMRVDDALAQLDR